MKNLTFLLLTIMVSVLFSCKQNNNNEIEHDNHMHQDSTMMHDNKHMMNSKAMYSCPMHPEVHGHKSDKCSECGMGLTMSNHETLENNK
ncbi:hypothetical protein FIA58_003135 [Flavobacterium jejuense]|uniref:Heavy metal binding domain-containing protein n=1 Tax=Flavobacterium jejuense TaxID=1544455 RepID=A0ABX0ILG8_9FLAO|nr:heavy metal-binding domain-containing protein [Flavobacterium jejuense]NHN24659.1 hypothetical protein [Flavobacterium jejuense]